MEIQAKYLVKCEWCGTRARKGMVAMKIWNGYQKGINLGGWLSQCVHTKEHYDSFFHEEDMQRISTWGVDHIRLPIDYNLIEDEEGNYREEGFGYIQKAIDWCEKYRLNMILDLHKTAGYSFDSGEKEEGFFESKTYQERFYRLWETLAEKFGKYRDRLAFELLNEVTEKEFCEKWNQIADTCIRRIRPIAPDISILVGGYWNNNVAAVKDLAMPQDENIIYNFHSYDPLAFTHQGAGWVKGMPPEFRLSFRHTVKEMEEASVIIDPYWAAIFAQCKEPDRLLDEHFFENIFAEAVAVAEERNVCLYCGEYGVIDLVPNEDALLWYQAIHTVFEKYGIGRAAWCYREMDFGITDPARAQILDKLIKYL